MLRSFVTVLTFLSALVSVSGAACSCPIELNGKTYELGPISGTQVSVQNMGADAYNYYITICGDYGTCDSTDTSVSQFDTTGDCLGALGFWTPADSADSVKTLDSAKGSDGFTITLRGQYCDNISDKRTVTINFICDTTKSSPACQGQEGLTCQYDLTCRSKCACAGQCESSEPVCKGAPGGGGLSGGWWFIIILLILTFVYCGAGIALAKKQKPDTPLMDAIPHKEFWTTLLPQYFSLGVSTSKAFVQSKLGKGGGGGREPSASVSSTAGEEPLT